MHASRSDSFPSRLTRVALLCLFVPSAATAQTAQTVELRASFDRPPGDWHGVANEPRESGGTRCVQDFGFSPTRHAGGAAGEIGGRVSRSLEPASYARVLAQRSLAQPLAASGRLAVTRCEAGSGVLIGWFHHTSRGWRTPSSLMFRIDGEHEGFRVLFEYGTKLWRTGGGQTFEGRYQDRPDDLIPADGAPHTWSLAYDPAGAGGRGEITFRFDDATFRAALEEDHKEDGADLDRFGIINQQTAGNGLVLWLDDLEIDGERASFDADPGWTGVGNRRTFIDRAQGAIHDFGYRATARAGGDPGEIGGLVWRIESLFPERAFQFGAPVGRLVLRRDAPLEASGRIALANAASDSAVLIGWYNSRTAIGAPPANFLGVLVEGPSREGHFVRPAYCSSDHRSAHLPSGPRILPDGRPHRISVRWNPAAAGSASAGEIVLALGGESVSLPLSPDELAGAAVFDRFGVVSYQRGGHFVELYLDDLAFTAAAARGEERN